jgi:hypothetical protein
LQSNHYTVNIAVHTSIRISVFKMHGQTSWLDIFKVIFMRGHIDQNDTVTFFIWDKGWGSGSQKIKPSNIRTVFFSLIDHKKRNYRNYFDNYAILTSSWMVFSSFESGGKKQTVFIFNGWKNWLEIDALIWIIIRERISMQYHMKDLVFQKPTFTLIFEFLLWFRQYSWLFD